MLKQYAYDRLGVETVDIKHLSSLLFDMENKFYLTPEERYDFLTLKAGIYIHLFREYESGTSITEEAGKLGSQTGISGKKLYPLFIMQYRSYMYIENQEKLIVSPR